ncbi:hypothetical protein ACGYLO_11335 [Sulfitobacter sp. 1A13353]|uniref:hypothetical protein n=1 Tax=Sulfitobacter sp. 1A13353 TaxID=3368568 RepID=UPI003745F893
MMGFQSACFNVRKMRATITLTGVRTVLEVACAEKPISYEGLAAAIGSSLNNTYMQVAVLSDGHAGQPGAGMLERTQGEDRNKIHLTLTSEGRALVKNFTEAIDGCSTQYLQHAIIPAINAPRQLKANMTLGAFCVLMYIDRNCDRFDNEEASGIIARDLKLSNLPRILYLLSNGTEARSGLGLIDLPRAANRRKVVPRLTMAGRHLLSDITNILEAGSPYLEPNIFKDEVAHCSFEP